MRIHRLAQLVLFLLVLATSALAQSGLSAAVARTDITPPPGVDLWGYSDRAGPATSTLDPLYARVLVLSDATKSIAVVTLDLGRSFGPPQIAQVREKVRRDYRVDEVMFIASHTHSGPVIEDDYPGALPFWEQRALDRIVAAIGEAKSRLAPAKIGSGLGQAIIGHNRRVVQSDGSVKMLWRNSTGQQTGIIDPGVGVIRIDDSQGRAIAILVNYACHPVVFGSDNLRYSADFPGAMAEHVETSFEQSSGKRPLCFFLQGAPGDINPLIDKTPLPEDADQVMRTLGRQLGSEVVRVAKTVVTEQSPAELAFASELLTFRNRWDLEKLRAMLTVTYGAQLAQRYQRYVVPEMRTPVTTLVINKRIAIVGLAGEPFVGLQLLLKQKSPIAATFLCGYTNGYYGYFPTISAAVSGGYGADTVVTRVEVGAGERMIDCALVQIYRVIGRLRDKPDQP